MAQFSIFRLCTFWILGLCALLLAAGCADERERPQRSAPAFETYAVLSQVPTCNPSHMAQVYYVASEDQFYFCDGTRLRPIDLSGQDGEDGVSWLIATSDAAPGD